MMLYRSLQIKYATSLLLPALIFSACQPKTVQTPDVSHISVTVKIQRFDRDFFRIDTNHLESGVSTLYQQYPHFFPDYVEHVLNAGPLNDSNLLLMPTIHYFLSNKDYRALQDTVDHHFPRLDKIERELEQCFRFMKHYFPWFRVPPVITFISGLNNYGAITTRDSVLGIGLDMFLGKDYPFYKAVQDPYPQYLLRRFEPAYISVSCMKVIQQELYPPRDGLNLLEQMVEKGKQLYFLDKVMPFTPDTIKTGYTREQLDWCYENEANIWNYFVFGNLLYESDFFKIRSFITEGPTTQDMPGSPGNIGSFIGWQIVKRYMERHPEISLSHLMQAHDAQKILDEAKYKPKGG